MPRALTVETRRVEALIPYAKNARTHSDAQIAASIVEFGWSSPILADSDNGVISGHRRLLAGRRLGMTEVPVIELAHLCGAQQRALLIAENRIVLNGGWDDALLVLESADLANAGYDLDLTGFSASKIKRLFDRVEDGATTGGDPEPATRETDRQTTMRSRTKTATTARPRSRATDGGRTAVRRSLDCVDARHRLASFRGLRLGPGTGLPGDWHGRISANRRRHYQIPDSVICIMPTCVRSASGGYAGVERDRSPDLAVQMLVLWPTPTSLAPPKDGYNGAGNSAGLVAIRQIALGLFPTPNSACASDEGTFEGGVLPSSMVD